VRHWGRPQGRLLAVSKNPLARLSDRERTVRAHVSRIILKLGVASRVGAAVAFVAWTVRVECGGAAMAEQPMA
jgi:hypothetical protein